VRLKGSQTTVSGDGDFIVVSSNASRGRPNPRGGRGNSGVARGGPRTASGSLRASTTAGISKPARGSRPLRSQGPP